MATATTKPPYNPDVLLHVDLNYTTAVLEDWGLDSGAIAEIHRSVARRLDRGDIDAIIADLIMDIASQWKEQNQP